MSNSAPQRMRTGDVDPLSLEHLQGLCRIPSLSDDKAGLEAAANWLVETYGDMCHLVERFEEDDGSVGGLLMCIGPPGVDRIVFFNYFDTTPAGHLDAWRSPPFAAELHDGRIYARGASNKGELISRLEAVRASYLGDRLRREVVFWLDAGEERGSPNLIRMLDRWRLHLDAPILFWNTGFINSRGEPVIGFGFKGSLQARLSAGACGYAGHSGVGVGTGAITRMLHLIAPLVESRDFPLMLHGRGIDREEDVRLVGETGLFDRFVEQARKDVAYRGWSKDQLLQRTVLESTVNLPWLRGGSDTEVTRYSHDAHCVLEFRLVAPDRPEAVFRALQARCEAAKIGCESLLQLEPYENGPASRRDLADLLNGPLGEAFGRTPRILPVVPFSAAVAPVASTFRSMNIVSVGLTDPDSHPHAANESISLSAFQSMSEFLARLVDRNGGQESEVRYGE